MHGANEAGGGRFRRAHGPSISPDPPPPQSFPLPSRWLLGVVRTYAASSSRAPYRARAWHAVPGAGRLRAFPLEPVLKLVACFIGINGELWFGHESWR